MSPTPVVGARVLVPLGSRVLTGCVVDRGRTPTSRPPSTIKPVIEVLDAEPFLPEDVVRLATWVADYYACGIGSALAAAMPPMAAASRAGGAARGFRTVRVAALTAQGDSRDGCADAESRRRTGAAPRRCESDRVSARRSRSWRARPTASRPRSWRHAASAAPALSRLATLGLVRSRGGRSIATRSTRTVPARGGRRVPALVLTTEQDAALARLRRSSIAASFQAALLHGVTGSGKTEIYLRLATDVRRRGRGVLLLVPEIALTPAVARRFRQAFGERVAIQHSGLSDGERHDQWQRIRRGDVDVVVGTQSAVFAPLARDRPRHRRRGARRLVQAGRDAALSRPRRRGHARAPGRRAGRARLGDAVAGELPERAERALHARHAEPARARSAAGRRAHRRHARGVRGRRARMSS